MPPYPTNNKKDDKFKEELESTFQSLLKASKNIDRGKADENPDLNSRKASATVGSVRKRLQGQRSKIDKRYFGDGYTGDRRAKIKLVTLELAAIIDYGTAQITRRLLRSTHFGKFVPSTDMLYSGEDMDPQLQQDPQELFKIQKNNAEDATKMIGELIVQDATFVREVRKWIKDSLMDGMSILKVWMDMNSTVVERKGVYNGAIEVEKLLLNPGVSIDRILEYSTGKVVKLEELQRMLPQEGEDVIKYKVEYTKTTRRPKLRFTHIPGKNFRYHTGGQELETCPLVADDKMMTRGEIAEMFPDINFMDKEYTSCFEKGDSKDENLYTTTCTDAYINTTWKGKPSIVRGVLIGAKDESKLIMCEPVARRPYADIIMEPVGGQWPGVSLGSRIVPNQTAADSIIRLIQNGTQQALRNTTFIGMDSLKGSKWGNETNAVIKLNNGQRSIHEQILHQSPPMVAPMALPVLEKLTADAEKYSGIVAEVTPIAHNESASAALIREDRERNMADIRTISAYAGIKQMMEAALCIIVNTSESPRYIKGEDGMPVMKDPRQWDDQMTFEPTVGMGRGQLETEVRNKMLISDQIQGLAAQGLLESPLVMKAMKDVVSLLDHSNEDMFDIPDKSPEQKHMEELAKRLEIDEKTQTVRVLEATADNTSAAADKTRSDIVHKQQELLLKQDKQLLEEDKVYGDQRAKEFDSTLKLVETEQNMKEPNA